MEVATITALLTAGLAIIGVLLKAWQARQPQRDQEDADEKIQQGRADIANGNTDNIAVRIDSLLPAAGAGSDSPAGVESAEDIERRISRL